MAISAPPPVPRTVASGDPPANTGSAADGGDWDFSFHDLVSIVNPLQHIPVVSTLYRKLTGDTIKPLERIAGDALYGGWMGLVSSVANLIFEKETGKDFGDTVLAFVGGDSGSSPATTQTAATDQTAATLSTTAGSTMPILSRVIGADTGQLAPAPSIAGAPIDASLGQRAIYAYRHAMGMKAGAPDAAPAF